jgi:hypothetical protein
MSQLNLRSSYSWLIPLVVSPVLLVVTPSWGHKIKTDAQVGAMIHFEPQDQPKAQESTQVWFALTKKGGKSISLQSCNCQLQLWQGQKKISAPVLQAINAEKYQGIPSAMVLFPQAGAYTLKLIGQSKIPADFQPFQLEFDVIVMGAVAATSIPTTISPNTKIEQKVITSQNEQSSFFYWITGGVVLTILGSTIVWKNR